MAGDGFWPLEMSGMSSWFRLPCPGYRRMPGAVTRSDMFTAVRAVGLMHVYFQLQSNAAFERIYIYMYIDICALHSRKL